jgi:hypothetical protein
MCSISPGRLAYRSLCIVIAITCLAGLSLAQETGNCTTRETATRPDCPGAIAFFQKLQAAVSAGDKTALASMVSYPMRAAQNGKRIQIRTRQQFLQVYPQLFNPAVICAIKSAGASDVWGNDQGFMVGRGVIWWDAVIPSSVKNPQPDPGKYPFKIISLNGESVMTPGCRNAK